MASTDKQYALTLIADPQIGTSGADLDRLQKAAIDQLSKIRGLENEAAQRAIFTGLALHRIKFSIGHGKWEPWVKDNVKDIAARQVRYYMKLALVFLASSKPAKTELLALGGANVDLATLESVGARRFVQRVQTFVGDLSLNELLEKHGIKGMTRGDDDAAETPTGAGEQLLFTEIAEMFHSMRSSILTPESLMRLQPKQLDAINAEMENAHSLWRKLYDEARGNRKSS